MNSALSEAEQAVVKAWCSGKGQGFYRRTCPACSSNRKNKKSTECLSVTVETGKILYNCWHCEVSGAIWDNQSERRSSMPSKPAPVKTTGAVKDISPGPSQAVLDYMKTRGISEPTAKTFGLAAARAYFPEIRKETTAIAFPYFVKGKVHGHKVRSLEEKAFVCDKALNSLFGIQNVDTEEEPHFILCEGELDPLSYQEVGIVNAVSVPNGAASTRNEDNDPAFLWEAKEHIDKAKKIYISTDNDEPGIKLGEELARRIGKHRCWKVNYPEGCKDANDVLMRHGGDVLVACFDNAEPWPVEGLYEVDYFIDKVMELYDNGFSAKVPTGMVSIDELYSIGAGLLTVVTGIPSNGKSTFVDQMMINQARLHGTVSAICSFENPPYVHIAKLMQMLTHKHFFAKDIPGERMSRRDVERSRKFIAKHFKFMHQDDGQKATIESIVMRIKTAVFRWGVKCVVIDPYNYIHRPATIASETQFIDDILTALRLVAMSHDLHIWFVAHPTKMTMDAEGNYQIPKGYSISGSAAWYSKPDFGLTVHRSPTVPGEVKIVNWKTRFDWLGSEGQKVLLYDNTRNTYVCDPTTDLPRWEPDDEF